MVGELFLSILVQLLFTVGTVTLFGLLTFLANKGFYRLVGNGRAVCYATGLIGTPLHEGSHALMCLVFGHRITDIKLFQMDDDSGVLGYVRHTYNPRSLWQQIGNFFIGTAPVLLGSGVILFLMFAFARPSFDTLADEIFNASGADGIALLPAVLATIGRSFFIVFAPSNFISPLWWLFAALSFCIALHVNLSPQDVSGAVPGLVMLVLVFFALDLILALVQTFTGVAALTAVTSWIVSAGALLTCYMALSLVFSLVLLIVAGVVRLIVTLVKKLI